MKRIICGTDFSTHAAGESRIAWKSSHRHPATAICQAAERLNADVIHMASRGGSRVSRKLRKSVADAVKRRTGRPVVVVPRKTTEHLIAEDLSPEQVEEQLCASTEQKWRNMKTRNTKRAVPRTLRAMRRHSAPAKTPSRRQLSAPPTPRRAMAERHAEAHFYARHSSQRRASTRAV